MASYRQQLGFYNYLDYVSTNNNTAEGSDHVNIGVRRALNKQSRHHRRLGHLEQKILIGTIIIVLCFVLGASAYIFLSRDHSPGHHFQIS